MLIKPQHKERKVVFRKIDTVLLQALHQEVLKILETYRALSVQINQTEGVNCIIVLATFIDKSLLMRFNFLFKLSVDLKYILDLYEFLVVYFL